jgi:hypothetical protein
MSFQWHIFLYQSILSNSDLYSSFQWVEGPGRGPIPDLLSKKLESVGFPVGGKCSVNTPIDGTPLLMEHPY